MAKNFNVVSATFDGQIMGQPMQYRMIAEGQTIEDSAGTDVHNSTNDLVSRRFAIQVQFKDWDNAKTMALSKHGVSGSLVLVTDESGTGTDKTLTLANTRSVSVDIGAEHNGLAVHVATFVSVSTDGSVTPLS